MVAGTFTIGFGERLTLDNTRRVTPRGIYLVEDYRRVIPLSQTCKISGEGFLADPTSGCDLEGGKNLYITPDYTWRESFRGIAGSIEDLKLGAEASMSLYGFASYQTRDLYQYEMFDRAQCEDPRSESDSCKAPQVFVGNDLSRDGRLKFTTLPGLYEELVGGGHVDFKPSDRYRIGFTGYGATTFFHGTPLRLEPQEWSRTPFGGPFGAVGLDLKAQFGQFGLFLEAARSFDSIKAGPDPINQPAGGGGFGVEQRTVFNPRRHQFEFSLRYYDNKFLNPLARPIASPDEFEGQSARNEYGARLRYFGKLGYDFEFRALADFWSAPFASRAGPAGIANLYSRLRLDYEGYRVIAPAVWFDIRNKNLASSQHVARPHLQSGRLRALAVTTSKRSGLAPELPTIEETLGLKDFDLAAWTGLFGPAGMPKEVTDKLSATLLQIMAKPDVRERILASGAEPTPSDATAFAALVKRQLEVWGRKVADAGIQPE